MPRKWWALLTVCLGVRRTRAAQVQDTTLAEADVTLGALATYLGSAPDPDPELRSAAAALVPGPSTEEERARAAARQVLHTPARRALQAASQRSGAQPEQEGSS
jgi:hypothetical protein